MWILYILSMFIEELQADDDTSLAKLPEVTYASPAVYPPNARMDVEVWFNSNC